MSREESYTESELKVFEMTILVNIQQLKVMFNKPLNIILTKYLIKTDRKRLLIGVLILKESSLHYLQRNVDFLSYIAGSTMQVRFQTAAAFKFFLIITSVTDFHSVFSSCNL